MENKKVKLTKEDFLFVATILLDWGFKKITRLASANTFRRLDLSAPRKIVGREVGFVYVSENGYKVIVWTSYLEEEEEWREVGTDICWVLISEGDRAKYFAKPLARIDGVIMKLLRYAWVSKWKVDNRPHCDECDDYMHIHRKKNTRQYFWICKKDDHHEDHKPRFKSWDFKLPPKAKEFVTIRRDLTKKYKEFNEKNGITPTPAAVKRKKWPIGKPHNVH